jgi:hypothetical protein
LYDIPKDPTQLTNLAEKYPDRVQQLAKQALDWQATLPKGPIEESAGKLNFSWPTTSNDGPPQPRKAKKKS